MTNNKKETADILVKKGFSRFCYGLLHTCGFGCFATKTNKA